MLRGISITSFTFINQKWIRRAHEPTNRVGVASAVLLYDPTIKFEHIPYATIALFVLLAFNNLLPPLLLLLYPLKKVSPTHSTSKMGHNSSSYGHFPSTVQRWDRHH